MANKLREGVPADEELELEDDDFDDDEQEEDTESESSEDFEDDLDDEDLEDTDVADDDDFEFEENEDGSFGAGEITIEGKRYHISLIPLDDEEAEEEAEGETPEEEDAEGEEGEEAEEEAEGEKEPAANPFAASDWGDDEAEEKELEEAVRLGLSDAEILKMYEDVKKNPTRNSVRTKKA